MAVVDVKPKWSGDTAESSKDGPSAQLQWTVLVDDPADTSQLAKLAIGIPRVGNAHPDDPFMFARNVRANKIGPELFEVTVTYASATGAGDGVSPLDVPPVWSWDTQSSDEEVDTDAEDKPIINSVGDVLNPPLVRKFYDPVLTIVRNEASFDPDVKYLYEGKVNSQPFLNVNPGLVLMSSITSQEVLDGGMKYYTVTYVLVFRLELLGWKRRVLNQGVHFYATDDEGNVIQEPVPFTDKKGNRLSEPRLLAADGTPLPDGATPHWLEFTLEESKDFGDLELTG